MKKSKWLVLIGLFCCLMLTACGNTSVSGGGNDQTVQQNSSDQTGQNAADAEQAAATEAATPAGDAEGTDSTSDSSAESADYYFAADDLDIHMNDAMAPILEKLGEPNFYFEAPSCAFEGMDRIYTYNGFEIYTYMENDTEYVFSIVFTDDSRKTREGAGLGTTLAELEQMYGTGYEQNFEQYTYYTDVCRLSFILENDAVISVEYYLILEE